MDAWDGVGVGVGLAWLAGDIAFSRSRRAQAGAQVHDRGSFRLLWAAIFSSISAAYLLKFNVPGARDAGRFGGGPWPVLPGLALVLAGLALRWAALRQLGPQFTVDVAIVREHRLVQRGLYRRLRHPAYAGLLLSLLGLGLALGNAYSLAAILPLPLAALLYRIRVEERALRAHFGGAFDAYARRSWRLLPGIY